MCVSQRAIVDAHIREFLGGARDTPLERSVA